MDDSWILREDIASLSAEVDLLKGRMKKTELNIARLARLIARSIGMPEEELDAILPEEVLRAWEAVNER